MNPRTTVLQTAPLGHSGILIRVWRTLTASNREPLVLETNALPIELRIHIWRKTEESNPIPVKRTWFSRPVAGPTPLHHLPYRNTLVQTCFYMAPEIRIELILTDSKSAVLPLHNSGIKHSNFKRTYCFVRCQNKKP